MVSPGGVPRRMFGWRLPSFSVWSAGSAFPVTMSPISPASMQRAPRQRAFRATEHLAHEAIAAYVDGELPMSAYLRAGAHLSMCDECRDQVSAQIQARSALRQSGPVGVPESLLSALSQIPASAALRREFPVASPTDSAQARRKRR
ncbi:zf-HC2 domain-containing protein [Hoyosella subflava]|uniref:zf-HC2 domain-containing protein n=1 Tax=Hoyosella subflava TaxID=639313 RepID=UPI00059CFCCF|nr:zf-HC2 domain-containing protein [Hoyosella subflava]